MEEPLTTAEQRLARRSRHAALISLAGFLIVLVSIGYSAWEIHQLEGRKVELQSETRRLTEKSDELSNEIRAKQERLDRIGFQLATNNVGAAKQTLAKQSPTDATPKGALPRVYIQLRSEDQRGLYDSCAASLKEAGFEVPSAEIIPDKGPRTSEVRYFRAAERGDAEKIAEVMRKWPVGEVTVAYVRGYEDSKLVKPHQFEVWIAPPGR